MVFSVPMLLRENCREVTSSCCIVCLPPHFKDIPNVYSAPPARKPIYALSMRPPPTIYLSWCVFLQRAGPIRCGSGHSCLYAKLKKVGGLWHRIIPELSDGVRACFQRPNSIIGDAFSCYAAVDGARLVGHSG